MNDKYEAASSICTEFIVVKSKSIVGKCLMLHSWSQATVLVKKKKDVISVSV